MIVSINLSTFAAEQIEGGFVDVVPFSIVGKLELPAGDIRTVRTKQEVQQLIRDRLLRELHSMLTIELEEYVIESKTEGHRPSASEERSETSGRTYQPDGEGKIGGERPVQCDTNADEAADQEEKIS